MKRFYISKKYKLYAIVDDEDYDNLKKYKWNISGGYKKGDYYAATVIDGRTIYMHRLITGARSGEYVDHINGNMRDNRRKNLRIVDQTQNNANYHHPKKGASKYKGVSWCKYTGRWRVRVTAYGHTVHVGRFDTETEAAKAYNTVAKAIFGGHAYLNKIKI